MKRLFVLLLVVFFGFMWWVDSWALSFNGVECQSIQISSQPVVNGVAPNTYSSGSQLTVTCTPLNTAPTAPEPVPVPPPVVPPAAEAFHCTLTGNAGTKSGTVYASCNSNVVTYEWSEPTCKSYAMLCTVYPNPTGTYTMRARNAMGVSNTASITLTLFGY